MAETLTADPGRHRALLERAEQLGNFGSWEWIPSENELMWSDNLYRIFGLEPGEITPTTEYLFERVHPDDRQHVIEELARLRDVGDLHKLDYRIVGEDGVRHIQSTLTVADWRDDKPHRLLGCAQDRTEQRRAEREIAAHWAISEALTRWDSLQTGARQVLSQLAGAMEFSAGAFWIPRGDVLRAEVLWRDPLADLPDLGEATRAAALPRGVGLPGRVWERREPISVRRIPDAAGTREAIAARAGLRGAVAIPALAGDEVLAVVELGSREDAVLTKRLMRSLSAIGHELGQFLNRRRGELEPPVLSPREVEVLQLSAEGLSAREAAERLFISPATVRTHLENIYTKLDVSDKASAVATALRLGVIE
jgi:DNA-binding CsgD family transcriptional regulator